MRHNRERRKRRTPSPRKRQGRGSTFPWMNMERWRIWTLFIAALAIICLSAQAASAAITITDDSGTTDEDTVLTGNVLSNDSGTPPLSVTSSSPITSDFFEVEVSIDSNGNYSYDPNVCPLCIGGSFDYLDDGQFEVDTFSYLAKDNSGAPADVGFVIIIIDGVNDAPVASGDSYSTNEDTPLTLADPGVLGNDIDADVEPMTAMEVSPPSNGTLNLNPDGSFTYTPDPNFNGSDSFTYRANDGTANSNVATVTITVNAVNDQPSFTKGGDQTVDEDAGAKTVAGWATGMSAGPANESGQTLTFNVSNDNNGLFSVQPDVDEVSGDLTYTPAADANGVATVSIYLTDNGGTANGGNDTSPTETFTITVNSINDVPAATDDAYAVDEDNTLNVAAPGVLSNDSDLQGGAPGENNTPLNATLVTDVNNGTLTLNGDGSFDYTPNADFNGTDSFTYTATDSLGGASATATVTITVNPVNDPPTAANGMVTTDEDIPYPFAAGDFNFTDVDGDSLQQIQIFGLETAGDLELDGTDVTLDQVIGIADIPKLTFTPDVNAHGAPYAAFQFKVHDGTEYSPASYTMTINVTSVNDAPVATDDAYITDEDTPLSIPASGVLGNDSDVDGDPLTAIRVNDPANGSVALNADGSFTYTPNANFNGSDSFNYKANDGASDSNEATVTVTVTSVNDLPTANDATVAIDENTGNGTPVHNVVSSDVDLPADALTYAITGGNTGNAFAINGSTGAITVNDVAQLDYEKNPSFSLTVQVTDSQLATDTATITINLNDLKYNLTIQKSGSAADPDCTVDASTGNPSGMGGGSTSVFPAAYTYEDGDVVTLTAADTYPGQGSVFKGWSGDVAGGSDTVIVTMDADKTATATFNKTYTLSIREAGTGLVVSTVTAGPGADSRFPGGIADGDYLYEEGDTVSLSATDTEPAQAGSEFQNWTVDDGDPGLGFDLNGENTSVSISGDLRITGNFRGTWRITSLERTGGTITPDDMDEHGYYGEEITYTIAANVDWVNTDVVVDSVSQGPLNSYTFSNIIGNHTIIAAFIPGNDPYIGPPAGDDQIYQTSTPPLVLLVMARNHKLYYEAYNDASDLNGDGTLDVGYNPSIDYYGYFDSYKTYIYDDTDRRFEPRRRTSNKKVPNPNTEDEWSGDFLNYLTMSRMDVLRKVLYGGYRSTDTASETVLQRVYIPQDAHAWGKEYESVERDGYLISDYAPMTLPLPWTRHLFANVTLEDGTTGNPDLNRPLLRIVPNNIHRIWEWVAKPRPVADSSVEQASTSGLHPGHPQDHAEYEDLVLNYATASNQYGSVQALTINGAGNPSGPNYSPYDQDAIDQNNYLTIFTGKLYVDIAGEYRFAVDGNDAVEVLIDGVVAAGYYGGHPECNCKSHDSSLIYLSAGIHDVEFRHEEDTGGDNYFLWWTRPSFFDWELVPAAVFGGIAGNCGDLANLDSPGLCDLYQTTYVIGTPATPESRIADYEVRVKVADATVGVESNCKQYPSGNYKPIGILQRHGEAGRLYFGLLTGSYTKNNSGGVLRKPIGSITDEIDPATGRFLYKYDSSVEGIVKTIDSLRVVGFEYTGGGGSDYSYTQNCGWITDRPINEGECRMWGNPVAEMMYEGMRYFAGKKAPLSAFTYSDDASLDDNILGLPKPAWDDPYETHNYCAKPFMLVLSDIYPTYDSDQLPGSYFELNGSPGSYYSTTAADLSGLNVDTFGDTILTEEGEAGWHYIGQKETSYDGSCLPKDISGFGDVRGLCPEEPTKQGSYYPASVAYYGRTQDMNAASGDQNVLSYMVGLASPLPRLNIQVGSGTVTLVPFAKSVYWSSERISPDRYEFQPTNTIVDFFVENISPTYGRFRINYEDVEQGADHDMDAIVIYEYQVIDNNNNPVADPADGTKLRVSLLSEYAAGGIIQHMGYVISGTTADGTYLEVRDWDTDTDEDVDYFLDTPPGVLPGTASDWDDDAPLPLTATRIFEPGVPLAATLLKDPLWYAAKWGGFNDLNGSDSPDTDTEWDEDSDGVPDTYFYVVNPLKLEQQLNRSFADIISRGVSHVAPVVGVDAANRTQSGDDLYMAFFKPVPGNYWQGNLKKYGLDYLSRDECGRVNLEWTVVDKDGNIAGDCNGAFKPATTSFWSASPDGGYVNRGGVGERLKEAMPGSDPVQVPASGPYYNFRNIYTYRPESFTDSNGDGNWDTGEPFTDSNSNGKYDGDLIRFTRANLTNNDLDVGTDLERYKIINFIYGYTFDADPSTGDPVAKRDWVLGDMIHSEPRVIDYLDETGNLERRYIAIGANDGMIHVFTDRAIPSEGYAEGDEIFAFVPADLLIRLKEFGDADTHIYTVDGTANLNVSSTFNDIDTNGQRDAGEYYYKTIVFGERRGGRSYWALDVTDPDPSQWTVKWHVTGGSGGTEGLEELGYTWNKPFFTRIRTTAGTVRDAVIFAGGYDPLEDGYPEAFDDADEDGIWDFTDSNNNGIWDPGEGETYAVTVGGTEGHDKGNPGTDFMGRGIFVLDLENGSPLFIATYGSTDVATGTDQRYAAMKYCFPADISVIPFTEENLLMYAADIYGQIWKITYDYNAASMTRWRVRRIFTANPGSTLASGSTDITSASLNPADAGRKTFYSPDVSYFGNDWAVGAPVLYFGTGDKEHPRYRMISNRVYAISDTDSLADETDLLNLTCDELDRHADANADGTFDTDDVELQNELANLLFDHETNGLRGTYKVLDKQGHCIDDPFDHTGEQVLSQPTLFFKNVYFTSYQAVFDDPCNPQGNALIYALDYSWFTAGLNFDTENDTAYGETRNIRDTYRVVTGSSIPSGIRIITREGKAAGLTSAGGSLVGAGEEGSTTIPGPPTGVSPILWETE